MQPEVQDGNADRDQILVKVVTKSVSSLVNVDEATSQAPSAIPKVGG